jgi:hypothetical protein
MDTAQEYDGNIRRWVEYNFQKTGAPRRAAEIEATLADPWRRSDSSNFVAEFVCFAVADVAWRDLYESTWFRATWPEILKSCAMR